MTIATYSVILRDPFGTGYRKDISGVISYMEIWRAVNAVGFGRWHLPMAFGEEFLPEDARIFVYEQYPGQPAHLLMDTSYLLQYVRIVLNERGEWVYELEAPDQNDLLDRRIIAYAAGSSQAEKTSTAADNMIKAVARENFGSLASVAARDWSAYLSVQADTTQAPTISKAFAHRAMLATLQEIAQESIQQGTYLAFDIVATSESTMEFQTFTQQRGVDRRATSGASGGLTFSPDRRNMGQASYTRDYRESASYIYAGGQGQGSNREVQEASDSDRIGASLFGRSERFIDARQTATAAKVLSEARAGLHQYRPRGLFQAELHETDTALFGVHYGFGDYVTNDFASRTFDTRLDVVRLTLTRQGQTPILRRDLSVMAIEEM